MIDKCCDCNRLSLQLTELQARTHVMRSSLLYNWQSNWLHSYEAKLIATMRQYNIQNRSDNVASHHSTDAHWYRDGRDVLSVIVSRLSVNVRFINFSLKLMGLEHLMLVSDGPVSLTTKLLLSLIWAIPLLLSHKLKST